MRAARFGEAPSHDVFAAHLSIDEVRAAVAGRREFVEMVRDTYSVFLYTHPKGNSFPRPVAGSDDARMLRVLRECRGLVFARDGTLLARRYHKFFNVNEFPETHVSAMMALTGDNHVLLEKLDGSMVSPWVDASGTLVWATKAGINAVADEARTFVEGQRGVAAYEQLVMQCHAAGITPIFEWCSAARPVILSYPRDALVCTAMRERVSGAYILMDEMDRLCSQHNVPVCGDVVCVWSHRFRLTFRASVQRRAHTARTVDELLGQVRTQKGLEGCVLRFANGEQVKLKTDWYGTLCRGLQSTTLSEQPQERHLWTIVLDPSFDDIKCTVAEAERDRLERFNVAIFEAMEALLRRVEALLEQHHALSDAEFAALVKSDATIPSPVCFQMRRHQRERDSEFSALDALVAHLTRLVQKNLPTAQAMLGGLSWTDFPLLKRDAAVASYSEWH